MSAAEHSRAKTIFFAAIELPPDERRAYLDDACGEDTALRREVESLLKHHDPVSIFDKGAVEDRERGRLSLDPGVSRSNGRLHLSHLFESPNRRRLWVLAAVALLAGLGLWTHARIEESLHRVLANDLGTVLSAEVHALDHWIGDQNPEPTVCPISKKTTEA